ncbi:MAG: hypothetical protein K5917_05785 [Clostridiales bacterium]|nr:hypothetical protein [Clostridiales bacterium]
MSSSSKTNILSLNQWALSDKPKCEDFNYDNERIENILGTHCVNSTIHVTGSDKQLWNEPFVIGNYQGSNRSEVDFDLGFKPKIVLIFADTVPLYQVVSGVYRHFSAIATRGHKGYGLEITNSGFKITHMQNADSFNSMARLNDVQYIYTYIAFK